MMCVGVRGLEPGNAITEVDPLHEAEFDQCVERAVHAGDAGLAAVAADPVVDLLRRAAALVEGKLVDDRSSCAASTQAGVAESGERGFRPGRHSM